MHQLAAHPFRTCAPGQTGTPRTVLWAIGVHTPEFDFERNVANVRRATDDLRVHYPVAVDTDYAIWDGFGNRYWPALYLVDAQGRIRHHHFGEGDEDGSERVIQQLLTEAGARDVSRAPSPIDARGVEAAADWDSLGLARELSRPCAEATVLNKAGGRIAYRFHARDLHLVMAPTVPGESVRFRITLDGQPPGAAHGIDADGQGNGVATEPRLYQLLRQPGPVAERTFEMTFLDGSVRLYAVTFG